ncbi:CDP-glycerol glycerophosphotransferase family protein [Turicibacter sanguinis]|uniref:CDP-glycerol glycerophosphotransferase family protein n=1 Tax=Turicibacter sanguinis TaxID=154288 RepID=UPI0018AC0E2C|nr:CDP-glycerol glycerophosphotransferase family protein [Turicibacter sanguinis]MDB8553979.1 CDP-glycerol glycerophosphotransferase family protein [Turicibacter sanguinis]
MDIKVFIEIFLKRLCTIILYILRIFPIDSHKVVLSNFNGKGYGDNPKYIAEILREKSLYKLIWLCDDITDKFPNGVFPVKRFSLKGFYHLATSKIWIDNSRKGYYIRKRKNQVYIQTWHGGEGLKKCEGDAIEALPNSWIKASKNDSNMINFAISNSKFNTELYRRAFWYNGEILEFGSPRNDILYRKDKHHQIIDNVYSFFNIEKEYKIILYTPTFRDNSDYSVYDLNYEKVIEQFESHFSEKFKFIIKIHPKMDLSELKIKYNEKIIDGSNYSDLYELMIASNIMISDYSSCMFEMGYMGKPVFIYATDYEYYGSTRGFLFDLKELPYIFTTSNEELYSYIKDFNIDNYQKKLFHFNNQLGIINDGKGAYRVAQLIDDIINK